MALPWDSISYIYMYIHFWYKLLIRYVNLYLRSCVYRNQSTYRNWRKNWKVHRHHLLLPFPPEISGCPDRIEFRWACLQRSKIRATRSRSKPCRTLVWKRRMSRYIFRWTKNKSISWCGRIQMTMIIWIPPINLTICTTFVRQRRKISRVWRGAPCTRCTKSCRCRSNACKSPVHRTNANRPPLPFCLHTRKLCHWTSRLLKKWKKSIQIFLSNKRQCRRKSRPACRSRSRLPSLSTKPGFRTFKPATKATRFHEVTRLRLLRIDLLPFRNVNCIPPMAWLSYQKLGLLCFLLCIDLPVFICSSVSPCPVVPRKLSCIHWYPLMLLVLSCSSYELSPDRIARIYSVTFVYSVLKWFLGYLT